MLTIIRDYYHNVKKIPYRAKGRKINGRRCLNRESAHEALHVNEPSYQELIECVSESSFDGCIVSLLSGDT